MFLREPRLLKNNRSGMTAIVCLLLTADGYCFVCLFVLRTENILVCRLQLYSGWLVDSGQNLYMTMCPEPPAHADETNHQPRHEFVSCLARAPTNPGQRRAEQCVDGKAILVKPACKHASWGGALAGTTTGTRWQGVSTPLG